MRLGKSIGFCAGLLLAFMALCVFPDIDAAEIRIIGEARTQSETEAREGERLTETISRPEIAMKAETALTEEEPHAVSDVHFPDEPLDPAEEGINAAEATEAARTLYSKMQHYAEASDNDQFSALFEADVTAEEIQAEMKALLSRPAIAKSEARHVDVCYLDPTDGKADSPFHFGVALTDYVVSSDGSVEWYSILMKVADYSDGWKAGRLPEGNLLEGSYEGGYLDAVQAGRSAADLYPYFGLRFGEGGVFEDAFYSLIHMAWEEEDGSISFALWLANGTGGTKWCDSIEVTLNDLGSGEIASTSVPVQTSVSPGESGTIVLNIPAEAVGRKEPWNALTVRSNLFYQ